MNLEVTSSDTRQESLWTSSDLEEYEKIVESYDDIQSALAPVLSMIKNRKGFLVDSSIEFVAQKMQIPKSSVIEFGEYLGLFEDKRKEIDPNTLFDDRVDLRFKNSGLFSQEEEYRNLKHCFIFSRPKLLEKVKQAKIIERCSSGVMVGDKWEIFSKERIQKKYLICPVEKSPIGPSMDRFLVSKNVTRLIEGMIISAWILGVDKAYICVNGEFEDEYNLLNQKIEDAKKQNYLGKNIFGQDFNFDLYVHKGGPNLANGVNGLLTLLSGNTELLEFEKTNDMSVLYKGYRGCPTMINNIETFLNIPSIVYSGEHDKRILGVTGDVSNSGVREVPLGQPLKNIINDYFGGVREGKELKALIMSGNPLKVLSKSQMEQLNLDYNQFRKNKLSWGDGNLIVFDNTKSIHTILKGLAKLFLQSNCGRCSIGRDGVRIIYEEMDIGHTNGNINWELIFKLSTKIKQFGKCSYCGQLNSLFTDSILEFGDDV